MTDYIRVKNGEAGFEFYGQTIGTCHDMDTGDLTVTVHTPQDGTVPVGYFKKDAWTSFQIERNCETNERFGLIVACCFACSLSAALEKNDA